MNDFSEKNALKAEKRIKVAVVTGPTATGKTSFGVKLARKLGAEIVSADSRQVYKGLDIGSGKDIAEYTMPNYMDKADAEKVRALLKKISYRWDGARFVKE